MDLGVNIPNSKSNWNKIDFVGYQYYPATIMLFSRLLPKGLKNSYKLKSTIIFNVLKHFRKK